MSRDQHFISLALSTTYNSEHQFPMAAIIVQGNRVLSIGVNKYKTHPRAACRGGWGIALHAEIAAILGQSRKNLIGATIYVARRRFSGKSGMAKPCIHCYNLLQEAKIRKVVYTTDNGFEIMSVK